MKEKYTVWDADVKLFEVCMFPGIEAYIRENLQVDLRNPDTLN
jgi:hypothetical protein